MHRNTKRRKMTDELIKLFKLDKLNINKDLSYIQFDKESLKVHIYLNIKFISCPKCGSINIKRHGYRIKHVVHSISTQEPCHIVFHASRFICVECSKTFLEPNPFSDYLTRISYTTKLLVLDDLKSHTATFSSVAASYNISPQAVINIFDNYIHSKRSSLPEILCMDEIYAKKLTTRKYCCVMLDFKSKKLIDVVSSRHKFDLIDYFSRIPKNERKIVKYVVIDMYVPYIVVAKSVFFDCKIAVDSFHVISHLNYAMDTIRLSIMNKFKKGKSPIKEADLYYYMLKKFHYFFKKNFDDIYNGNIKINKIRAKWDKWEILKYLLDIDKDLKAAYYLKAKYQEFNATASYETCDNELPDLINGFLNSPFKPFVEFGKLLSHFKEEIKNSFIVIDNRRLSNGAMEGVNSRLKCLIKNANGYRNFSRFRNRCIYTINKDVPISLYNNKTKK